MSTLFFRQPRIIVLAIVVLVAAGLSALVSIGRQEDPTITNLFATVKTLYPGAEPGRVETLVTEKLENSLREIAAIDVIESTSANGISIISLELADTLSQQAIEVAWVDVRDALDDAQRELPVGTLPPELNTEGAGTFAAIVALTPESGIAAAVVQRQAENLADRLRRVGGTDSVELFGEIEEEIDIRFDPAVLSSLSLTANQVSVAVQKADAKVRAGRVRGDSSEYIIELAGELDALERIRDIPLQSASGLVMRLGDVATVNKGLRSPVSELVFHNGEPSVLIGARISDGLQVDVWMRDIRTALDTFGVELPDTLKLETVFDQSKYTSKRLGEVGLNMAIGMLLIILVLLVTLGVRAALIVAMVLPLVTLASIATLNALGMSIHQMSLTGLIVALGLLVDAAIVMVDEIKQRLVAGKSRLESVQQSVRRLFAPLLASTLTTALSFTPMVLLPGPAGDFVGSIAIAVILMLLWSFIIAVTVTAGVAGIVMPESGQKTSRFGNGFNSSTLSGAFRKSLSLAMRYPASSVALALVLPLAGFASAPTLTAQFFPGVDRDQFYIEVELSPGTSIDSTRRTVLQIGEQLRRQQGIRQVSWVVGKSAPPFYYNMVGGRDRAPEFAQALVSTDSNDDTARLVPLLQDTLGITFPQARVLVRDLVQGPPVAAPVEVRLVGSSLDTLKKSGDELRSIIAEVDEVTVLRTSLGGGAPKVVFDVDEVAANLAGFSLTDIAAQLETTLEGAVGGSLLDGNEELPVRVRVFDRVRSDLDSVANLPVVNTARLATGTTAQGEFAYTALPLSAIADVSLAPAQSSITRRNGERVNTVQAFLQYGVLPEEALKNVQDLMDARGFTLPEGYRIQFGGDSDARDNTLSNLLAPLGVIVTLSIASVVLTFNSFRLAAITMVVAGLSAGLSMLALAVFQYPFGINAIIGVIGSIGVSINAAIIILTGLQQNAAASNGDREAMVDVLMGSSRHIISTTVTTFGGFLPLILAGGGFWPPFAMSVAGGVLLSTVVSFYFTPPMFRLVFAGRDRQRPSRPREFAGAEQWAGA